MFLILYRVVLDHLIQQNTFTDKAEEDISARRGIKRRFLLSTKTSENNLITLESASWNQPTIPGLRDRHLNHTTTSRPRCFKMYVIKMLSQTRSVSTLEQRIISDWGKTGGSVKQYLSGFFVSKCYFRQYTEWFRRDY